MTHHSPHACHVPVAPRALIAVAIAAMLVACAAGCSQPRALDGDVSAAAVASGLHVLHVSVRGTDAPTVMLTFDYSTDAGASFAAMPVASASQGNVSGNTVTNVPGNWSGTATWDTSAIASAIAIVRVTITDDSLEGPDQNGTVVAFSNAFTIDNTLANQAPVLAPPVHAAGNPGGSSPAYSLALFGGESLGLTVDASDPDAGDNLTLTASVTGGNLSAAAAGYAGAFPVQVVGETPQLTLGGIATLAGGTIELTVRVADDAGLFSQYTLTITIAANAVPVLGVPTVGGLTLTGSYPSYAVDMPVLLTRSVGISATDADAADELTIQLEYAGGTVSDVDSGFGLTMWVGPSPVQTTGHVRAQVAGTVILRATVTDEHGASDTFLVTVNVLARPVIEQPVVDSGDVLDAGGGKWKTGILQGDSLGMLFSATTAEGGSPLTLDVAVISGGNLTPAEVGFAGAFPMQVQGASPQSISLGGTAGNLSGHVQLRLTATDSLGQTASRDILIFTILPPVIDPPTGSPALRPSGPDWTANVLVDDAFWFEFTGSDPDLWDNAIHLTVSVTGGDLTAAEAGISTTLPADDGSKPLLVRVEGVAAMVGSLVLHVQITDSFGLLDGYDLEITFLPARPRVLTFSAPARAEVGESIDLAWTLSGSPTAVSLNGADVSAQSDSTDLTYPTAPTPQFPPERAYRVVATGPGEPNARTRLTALQREGDTNIDDICGIAPTPDGGYVIAGAFRDQTIIGGATLTTANNIADGRTGFLARFNAADTLQWVKTFGTTDAVLVPTALAVGPDGSIAIAGSTTGVVIFGGGQPNQTIVTTTDESWFVARFSAAGWFLWADSFEQTGFVTRGSAVVVHGDGTVAVAGQVTGGAMTFGASTAGPVTPAGSGSAFVARYGADGRVLWARRTQGTGGPNGGYPTAIGMQPDGEVMLAGRFSAAQDVTLGQGEASEATLSGGGMFLARYTTSGGLVWARQATDDDSITPAGLAVLSDGSVAVGGSLHSDALFGPGEGNETLIANANGDTTSFVARFAWATGELQWVHGMTGDPNRITALAAMRDDEIVVVGERDAALTFDSGFATLPAFDGGGEWFVVRIAADGTVAYGRGEVADGNSPVSPRGVAISDSGEIRVAGTLSSAAATFGRGEPDERQIASAGATDIFVAHYTPFNFALRTVRPAGFQHAASEGGAYSEQFHGIAAMPDCGWVVVGQFKGSITLDPAGPTPATLTAPGNHTDGFVARYRPNGTLQWATTITDAITQAATCVAVRGDGSIVVGGFWTGDATSITFAPGEGEQTTINGDRGAFTACYSSDGTLQWVAWINGVNSLAIQTTLTTMPDGGVAIGGRVRGTAAGASVTFHGAGDVGSVAIALGNGPSDGFVARLAPDGALQWMRHIYTGVTATVVNAMACDPNGAIYACGVSGGTATFNVGEADEQTDAGATTSRFTASWDADGELRWTRHHVASWMAFSTMRVLRDGTIAAVGGAHGSSVRFNDGMGDQAIYNNAGNWDRLIIPVWRSDGSLVRVIWSYDGSGTTVSSGLVERADGALCVSVHTDAQKFILGEDEPFEVTWLPIYGIDCYVVAFDPLTGQHAGSWQFGGWADERLDGIAALPDGSVVVVGTFSENLRFGIGETNFLDMTNPHEPNQETFVARFHAPR